MQNVKTFINPETLLRDVQLQRVLGFRRKIPKFSVFSIFHSVVTDSKRGFSLGKARGVRDFTDPAVTSAFQQVQSAGRGKKTAQNGQPDSRKTSQSIKHWAELSELPQRFISLSTEGSKLKAQAGAAMDRPGEAQKEKPLGQIHQTFQNQAPHLVVEHIFPPVGF